ncbi:MAG: hypothetical protein ACMXYB_03115 [Candidatus Woesearchaeota archaeon]
MKIKDSKGNKKDISSIFHSKSQELLFKNIFYILSFLIFFVFICLAVLFYYTIPILVVTLIIILILAIISIIIIQEHLASIVFYIIKIKQSRKLTSKDNKNRRYKNLYSSKKSRFIFKNTPFNSKKSFSLLSKLFPKITTKSSKSSKNSHSSDTDYLEIK